MQDACQERPRDGGRSCRPSRRRPAATLVASRSEHVARHRRHNPTGVTIANDCHTHSITNRTPQCPRPARDNDQRSAFLHGLDLASRQPQLSGKQAIQAAGIRMGDDEENLHLSRRAGAQRLPLLEHHDRIELLHALDPTLQIVDIQSDATGQRRIVRLQRRQEERIDRPQVPSLQNRPVPGVVARRAPVDQPRIDAPAVGIDPDSPLVLKLAVPLQRLQCNNGRGGLSTRMVHFTRKTSDMPVHASRWEAHRRQPSQARCGRGPERNEDAMAAGRTRRGSAMPNRSRTVTTESFMRRLAATHPASPRSFWWN